MCLFQLLTRVGLELSNSLPCFTMEGWAKVNVAYPEVYVVENIAVVKGEAAASLLVWSQMCRL